MNLTFTVTVDPASVRPLWGKNDPRTAEEIVYAELASALTDQKWIFNIEVEPPACAARHDAAMQQLRDTARRFGLTVPE